MARYSSLIRKLVDATALAESHGEDVADSLKLRCFNDTGLVRQTLMNAVCDPRFKFHADTAGHWKRDARNALEALASLLESHDQLTEDDAMFILDNFLADWFKQNVNEHQTGKVQRLHTEGSFLEMKGKDARKGIRNAVSLLEIMVPSLQKEKEDDDEKKSSDFDSFLSSGEDDETEAVGQGSKSDEDGTEGKEATDDETEDDLEEMDLGNNVPKNPAPSACTFTRQLEESYLRSIPHSLIHLARMIGRMGDDGKFKTGRFLKAGKTDIAGITTGSDLTSLLPSEIAMLADSRTQDVFYRNFTAGRLQLFASASESSHHERHQDGPVIICIDTSSSMDGEPIMIARALTAAVALIAWRKNRNVVVVKYSTTYEYFDFGSSRRAFRSLADFLSIVSMGGNDENAMFQWLLKEIEPQLSCHDSADILCISDFGWTELHDTTLNIIEEMKAKGMKFYGLNVPHSCGFASNYNDFPYNPMEVCDSVWTYANGECKQLESNC